VSAYITYLMENQEETIRLEAKTKPGAVRSEAKWCGVKPGMHVLDAGCGPGKTTSILFRMIQPGGTIEGLDYSKERIEYAKGKYGSHGAIDFRVRDLRHPLDDAVLFDLIWARFVLEYNRKESSNIVKNLTSRLKPGGCLCLIDLDYNCLTHYELPSRMEHILFNLSNAAEKEYNFDPYIGRKLYAYLYDLGYENINIDVRAHHLFYGPIPENDMFNWIKKVEVVSAKNKQLFDSYPGGHDAFFLDFKRFFTDPRRFTYTPLILCKGTKPA
jgi:SAM-dependent methyltransferase